MLIQGSNVLSSGLSLAGQKINPTNIFSPGVGYPIKLRGKTCKKMKLTILLEQVPFEDNYINHCNNNNIRLLYNKYSRYRSYIQT